MSTDLAPVDRARLNQITDWLQTGLIAEAEQALLQELKQVNHPSYHHLLGICYGQTGRLSEAETQLNLALEITPNQPHLLSSLGNVYRHQGKIPQAIMVFQSVLKLEPKQISARLNLGITYFQSNEPSKAIDCFMSLLQDAPGFADAHFNLALCYLKTQETTKAEDHLITCLKHEPKNIKANFQLGLLHQQQQGHIQALGHFETVKQLQPNHADNLHHLGMIYLQLKRDQEGLEMLQKAKQLNPSLENIDHNLASVYLNKRDYTQALRHWLIAYEQSPSEELAYNIGVTYLYLGRYEESSDYFFLVLKDNPNHHPSLVNLGACYLQQGNITCARDYYQRALSIKHTPLIAYVLAALSPHKRNTYKKPPRQYIQDLFDHYAYHYDNHLLEVLTYQVPDIIHKQVLQHINPKPKQLSLLDLGCGTGLIAAKLQQETHTRVGIDASQNMIELARSKNIYTALHQGMIPDCLEPLNQKFDCITAGDLCPYFGCLSELIACIASCLNPGGFCLLTCENHYDTDYCLTTHARYSHNPKYIQKLTLENLLDCIDHETVVLRQQQGKDVLGSIFCFQLK